jgi:two-component system, chemotaxis family, chemotaxis protein CheY
MTFLTPDPKQRGILIVDDELHLRENLARLLKGNGYDKLFFANDGVEALEILHDVGPEVYLIILDIRMPRMDGITFFKNLTNTHNHPVGVIILTGHGSDEIQQEFVRMGTTEVMALDYVTKPFDFKYLLQDVERSLGRVYEHRLEQFDLRTHVLYEKMQKLEDVGEALNSIREIRAELKDIARKQYGLFTQLGLDLVRAILIALAFLALLYFGVGDFLKKLIGP